MLKLHLESLCFSLLVILFLKNWYILGSKENTIRFHVYYSKKENVFHCFCGFMGPNRPYQKLLAFIPLVTHLTCSRVLWRTFMCENMTAPASHTAKIQQRDLRLLRIILSSTSPLSTSSTPPSTLSTSRQSSSLPLVPSVLFFLSSSLLYFSMATVETWRLNIYCRWSVRPPLCRL